MTTNAWAPEALAIDRESVVPIYRQLYERLREQILTGALPEGTRLPPERALADRLGVNRSTIVHGYRELVADGLIEQRVGSGSRVAALRDGVPERSAAGVPWWVTLPPWRVGQYPAVLGELAASEHGEQIAFVQGVPPAEPSPLAELSASFARVGGNVNFVLTYGDSEGYGPLREAVAERMRRRGCEVDARDVMMLTGSTQGISLVAQSLAEPGDEIVVEAPTYPGALQVFQIHGLRAIPVPVDEHGVRVDHIEAILRTRRPRFIYTMPSLHNPTGVTLSEERRERLIVLARRWGVPLVEDDPYGELAHSTLAPLIARGSDDVIYLSSFSKTIAPSLRLGWMVAPRTIYDRLLLRKQSYDMATSMYIQAGVDDFMRTAYDAHLRALRIELAERRAIANAAIAKHWPPSLRVDPNADGYYVWASATREVRARALLTSAERRGVSFLFGEPFFAQGGGDHHIRLALTPVPREAIEEGIARIGEVVRTLTPGSLLDWYRAHGRAHLPWRKTRDPYRIVVSEFMLQQTQVERVLPLYEAFIAAYPDFASLAAAEAGDAVRLWRGLGYNSRAMRLHALACAVVERHGGALPSDRATLLALPGIGPYTASAVRAFAFELDDVALDTNVRRIAHRTGFGLEHPWLATDAELDARARAALEPGTAHDWNSAMMDVGATICTARAPKCLICPLRAGCAAAPVDALELAARARKTSRRSPQESMPFERTTRYLRGRIVDRLRDVPRGEALPVAELIASLAAIVPPDRIAEIPVIAEALERDGIVERLAQTIRLR